jgi:hypothetical protein
LNLNEGTVPPFSLAQKETPAEPGFLFTASAFRAA